MGHSPRNAGGSSGSDAGSESLGRAASEIRDKMRDNDVVVDVRVETKTQKIEVEVQSGLPPIARGVLGRVASSHGLTVEWANGSGTLTPK